MPCAVIRVIVRKILNFLTYRPQKRHSPQGNRTQSLHILNCLDFFHIQESLWKSLLTTYS